MMVFRVFSLRVFLAAVDFAKYFRASKNFGHLIGAMVFPIFVFTYWIAKPNCEG